MQAAKKRSPMKAVLFGTLVATAASVPARWMPSTGELLGESELLLMLLSLPLALLFLALLLYLPPFIGGYVSAIYSQTAFRLNAVVVGALFIPLSILLDYLRHGFLSFSGIPVLVVLFAVCPVCSWYGARLRAKRYEQRSV